MEVASMSTTKKIDSDIFFSDESKAPVSAKGPNIELKAAAQVNTLNEKRKALVQFYKNEKKIPVSVSPFYAPYLGNRIAVGVNGIYVYIPADGKTYQVNETHGSELLAKVRKIDAMVARQKRASDVRNNVESRIGELQL